MLYVTTRDQNDAHTAFKTLVCDVAKEGGCYIPFRSPVLEAELIADLLNKSFGDIVATILNRLFSANLSGLTVDFSIGRNCVKTTALGQKTVVAQLWHNPDRTYKTVEKILFSMISNGHSLPENVSQWAKIAIRFAVLFGIYSELLEKHLLEPEEAFDISVATDDMTSFMAAWYGKENGLPIRMILCGTDTENGIWDLIQRSEVNTAALSETVYLGAERLVYAKWGVDACREFVAARASSKTYAITEEMPKLSESCFCSVVGETRLSSVINNVYRTDNYLIDRKTALSYATMQDYRAKAGENRITLIFADNDPTLSMQAITEATGLSKDDVAALAKK